MKAPKVKKCPGVKPYKAGSTEAKPRKTRGTGAATKGTMSRGPMA